MEFLNLLNGMKEIKIYLADNLRNLRYKECKTQGETALLIGLKRGTYAKYEDGKNEPNMLTLLKISKYYKIKIESLLTIKLKTYYNVRRRN